MPAPKRMSSLDSKESLEWERCCDSASCQARTVRSSSRLQAPSSVPRRPASRESTGSSEWGWLRPTSQCKLEGMEQFRRSLRLIGLKPEDVGLESPQPMEYSYRCVNKKLAKPKLNTRLQRRTVSADDLRTLLEECPVKDSDKREMVAKAVYEEWYFKKQEELRRRKDMERDLESSRVYEMANQKKQQIERNQARFEEWVKQKVTKKREELSKSPDRKGVGKRSMSNPEQAEAAFLTWKQAKEKQLQTDKKNTRNEIDEQLERQAKRSEAERAFTHWKLKKEEELQKMQKEKERLDRMIKEDEERLKQQKAKESEISFKVWKIKKDRELQEKINKIKSGEEKKIDEAKKTVEERRYEANQAFLGWLDTVEQRERDQAEQASKKSSPRHSRRQSPQRSDEGKLSATSSRASSPGHYKANIKTYSRSRMKPARNKGN